jgi:hypothetical protein
MPILPRLAMRAAMSLAVSVSAVLPGALAARAQDAPASTAYPPVPQGEQQSEQQGEHQAEHQAGGQGASAVPAVRRSRAFKQPAAENPFAQQVVPWFSLAPQGSSLIRTREPGGLDMAAREDESDIMVYGRKKQAVDPRTDREHDYSAATWSDVGLPKDIPVGPPGSCSSGAYRTIGGQAATGADLMGGLGGGRC